MMQEILPLEARSWPRADGRIDLYCGLHARCAQMLFYQAGVELPRNAYLEVGNREMWYFLHSPITNFGPALALLRSGVKVYLFVDGNTCVGGLDTATESPLP